MLTVVQPPNPPSRQGKKKKKKGKKKRRAKAKNPQQLQGPKPSAPVHPFLPSAKAYVATLNNPFECPPVRLGFGTMIPTRIATAYSRGSGTLNGSDGSGQLWFTPGQVALNASAADGGFIMFSKDAWATAATFAGTGSVTGNPDDRASLIADFDQYRVISASIRVFAMIARTATPGVFGSGQYNPNSMGSVPNSTGSTPLSSRDLFALPETQLTFGYDPIQVNWRPDDIDRFKFASLNFTANNGLASNGPSLYVVFNNMPPGANIWWEAVAHYEGYSSSRASSQATVTDGRTVATEYSSIDSLWQAAKSYLGPAVQSATGFMSQLAANPSTVKTIATAYSLLNPTLRRGQVFSNHRSLMFDDWKG
jgi:hypothetical protein